MGNVVGSERAGVDLRRDLSMTYTVEGKAGVYEARVVVPEPGTVAMLLCGLMGAAIVWCRRQRRG